MSICRRHMLRLFHRWKWKGKNLPKKLGLPAVLASSMAMACTCRIGGIGKVVQSQFTCVGLVGHWQNNRNHFILPKLLVRDCKTLVFLRSILGLWFLSLFFGNVLWYPNVAMIFPKLAAQECARKPRFCARKPRFCARMRKIFWHQETIKIDLVWLILGATALNDTTLLGSSAICYDFCCFSHGFTWNPQLLLQDFAGHRWNPINLALWNMFFKKCAIKLFCEIKSTAFMAPPWAFNLLSGYCSAEYAFCRRSPRAYNIQIHHNIFLYIMLTCLLFHHVLCYRI